MLRLRQGLWAMESSSPWGCRTYLLSTAGRVFLIDPGPSFQLDVLRWDQEVTIDRARLLHGLDRRITRLVS